MSSAAILLRRSSVKFSFDDARSRTADRKISNLSCCVASSAVGSTRASSTARARSALACVCSTSARWASNCFFISLSSLVLFARASATLFVAARDSSRILTIICSLLRFNAYTLSTSSTDRWICCWGLADPNVDEGASCCSAPATRLGADADVDNPMQPWAGAAEDEDGEDDIMGTGTSVDLIVAKSWCIANLLEPVSLERSERIAFSSSSVLRASPCACNNSLRALFSTWRSRSRASCVASWKSSRAGRPCLNSKRRSQTLRQANLAYLSCVRRLWTPSAWTIASSISFICFCEPLITWLLALTLLCTFARTRSFSRFAESSNAFLFAASAASCCRNRSSTSRASDRARVMFACVEAAHWLWLSGCSAAMAAGRSYPAVGDLEGFVSGPCQGRGGEHPLRL
mmetsp:Transcript_133117/g.332303  ORF Transcript_133117/g.332303 Transcript_133117/m.332303 type:complete len:402 (+) Transcript_133117:231-1436(+)